MSVPSPKPMPRPQPGLPRTIGILNLLCGLVLLACGAGCLNLVVPFLSRNNPLQIEPAMTRDVLEQMRYQMVSDLVHQERSATSEVDRLRIRKARADLQSKSTDLTGKVDFAKINRDLPRLAHYLWADAVTGPLLNVAMVVAGVGLVLLKGWGRWLAIGVAALKIVRLIALNGYLALAVVPQMTDALNQVVRTDIGEEILKHAIEQQSAQRARAGASLGFQLSPADFVQVMRAFGYGYAATTLGLGLIYPVVSLIVLSRSGARLACQGDRPDDEPRPDPSVLP